MCKRVGVGTWDGALRALFGLARVGLFLADRDRVYSKFFSRTVASIKHYSYTIVFIFWIRGLFQTGHSPLWSWLEPFCLWRCKKLIEYVCASPGTGPIRRRRGQGIRRRPQR